jgi:acid phosphatase family membrane protein YuiD
VTLAFAAVVMLDAQTVRRAAGQQARLLNQIIDELFTEHHFSQQKLRELLGHTQLEVYLGGAMGILVGLLFHWNFG